MAEQVGLPDWVSGNRERRIRRLSRDLVGQRQAHAASRGQEARRARGR